MTKKRRGRATPRLSGDSERAALPRAGAGRLAAGTRLNVCLALALAALTIAVYAPVRHHDFVSLDDTVYVSENEHVARGLTAPGVVWALTSVDNPTANWHPVTWMSHMLDVELFGMNPGAHHVVSVVLHTLNSVVLFLLLCGTTGHAWRSACVAALFAVHPLHVESVAWIAERKDVLSTLFWFLAFWAYVRYTRQPGRVRYAAVIILFALGLMAKPMVITLPFTLLLLDWWPLGRLPVGAADGGGWAARVRQWVPLLVEKWPLFAMSALSAVMTVVSQRQAGAVVALEAIPVPARAANAALSYGTYAWQMIWPSGLSVFYPHSGSARVGATAAALLFLAGMSVAAAHAARTRRHVTAGWLWYLATLAPVIGLVQVGMQAAADRYTYVPLIGLFVLVVWELAERAGTRAMARMLASAAACAAIVASGVAARAQVAYWVNDASLWQHALDVDADNYYAHYALGRMLLQDGRRDDAFPHLERALKLAPWFAEVHDTIGLAHGASGRLDDAIEEHREALRLKPGLVAPRFNLGVAYERQGNAGEAAVQYREAIRRTPRNAVFRAALGHLLAKRGQFDAAMGELREALRLAPDSAEARYALASALAGRGDVTSATDELRKALVSAPRYIPAQSLIGELLLRQGQVDEAIPHLREAVRLEPGSAGARAALASALAESGRLEDAVVEYGEGVRLAPGDPSLRHSLGLCLARLGRTQDAVRHFSEAVRLRPDSDAMQVSLGMALAAGGDAQAGAAHLQAALRLNPGNEAAKAGLQALGR